MMLSEMTPGEPYKLGNLWVKVTPGTRGARTDLDRIIWVSPDDEGPWVAITMEAVAGVASLIAQNEATIWPKPRYTGDGLWRQMLAVALRDGLQAAKRFKRDTYGRKNKMPETCVCGVDKPP